MRVNLSVAMVDMVKPQHKDDQNSTSDECQDHNLNSTKTNVSITITGDQENNMKLSLELGDIFSLENYSPYKATLYLNKLLLTKKLLSFSLQKILLPPT
jgi:hypothetical protein